MEGIMLLAGVYFVAAWATEKIGPMGFVIVIIAFIMLFSAVFGH